MSTGLNAEIIGLWLSDLVKQNRVLKEQVRALIAHVRETHLTLRELELENERLRKTEQEYFALVREFFSLEDVPNEQYDDEAETCDLGF